MREPGTVQRRGGSLGPEALFRIIGSQPNARRRRWLFSGALVQAGAEHLARRPGAMKRSCGSQIELLLLLLHPDPGALRTFPLPLLVVDVSFDLPHRDLALSTCHVYSSIAPKSASPLSSAGLEQAALLQISNQNNPEARLPNARRTTCFLAPNSHILWLIWPGG